MGGRKIERGERDRTHTNSTEFSGLRVSELLYNYAREAHTNKSKKTRR